MTTKGIYIQTSIHSSHNPSIVRTSNYHPAINPISLFVINTASLLRLVYLSSTHYCIHSSLCTYSCLTHLAVCSVLTRRSIYLSCHPSIHPSVFINASIHRSTCHFPPTPLSVAVTSQHIPYKDPVPFTRLPLSDVSPCNILQQRPSHSSQMVSHGFNYVCHLVRIQSGNLKKQIEVVSFEQRQEFIKSFSAVQ